MCNNIFFLIYSLKYVLCVCVKITNLYTVEILFVFKFLIAGKRLFSLSASLLPSSSLDVPSAR